MSLSIWDLFKAVFKWKIAIIIVTVLAYVAASVYVKKNQTYKAQIVIQYNDGCISEGRTLDGEKFDVNEVKSPTVVLNVLKDLGYESKRIESMRENITISAVTPKTVDNLKAAKEKLGEEYQFFPKTFTITYKGGSSFGETRDILSSVITNYFKYYSEKYLYLATLNEVDYDVNKKDYDYLEQAEQIDENVKATIEALTEYVHDSNDYRSNKTGVTFDDLLKEFERIEEYSMPKIFTKIYDGQVTKDEGLLIGKYTERMEQNLLEMDNLNYKAALTEDRMNAYVEANRNLPNAYNNGDDDDDGTAIIKDIEYDSRNEVDTQTVYDGLIISYAGDRVSANSRKLSADYCSNVISKFSGERSPLIDYDEYENEVKERISDVLDELEDLYEKANINISDYNAYIPSTHIRKLSGIQYFENMSGSVYKLIAIVGGFGMSCIAAIAYEVFKKYSLYGDAVKEEDGESDEEDEQKEDGEETEV